jgi:hypothetical protein
MIIHCSDLSKKRKEKEKEKKKKRKIHMVDWPSNRELE